MCRLPLTVAVAIVRGRRVFVPLLWLKVPRVQALAGIGGVDGARLGVGGGAGSEHAVTWACRWGHRWGVFLPHVWELGRPPRPLTLRVSRMVPCTEQPQELTGATHARPAVHP